MFDTQTACVFLCIYVVRRFRACECEALLDDTLGDTLTANKPSALDTVRLERFDLDDAPPAVASARVLRSRRRADGSVMLELGLAVDRLSSALTVTSKVATLGIPLNISMSFQATRLDLRLCLTFTDAAPYVGSLRFSLADMPETTMRIAPEGLGGLNLTDLPGVDAWLKGAVEGALVRTLVEPNSYLWDVEQWWATGKARQAEEERTRVNDAVAAAAAAANGA